MARGYSLHQLLRSLARVRLSEASSANLSATSKSVSSKKDNWWEYRFSAPKAWSGAISRALIDSPRQIVAGGCDSDRASRHEQHAGRVSHTGETRLVQHGIQRLLKFLLSAHICDRLDELGQVGAKGVW